MYGKMFKVSLAFSHQRSILGVYNWDREGRTVKGIDDSRHYIYSCNSLHLPARYKGFGTQLYRPKCEVLISLTELRCCASVED